MTDNTISDHVTLVEILELTRPYDEVVPFLSAAIRRLETEGVKALLSSQFYRNEAGTELGAVIRFANSSQMMEHVNMVSGWEEFHRFSSMIKLIDMRVHGKLDPEAEAWIRKFNGPIKKLEHLVVGFVR